MKNTLNLSFDIGHSSIGWAVFDAKYTDMASIQPIGCGVVLFEKDSALANVRRGNRQQRRHVRATRQRIFYIRRLLAHLGVMNENELEATHGQGKGHPAPWLLAARVLASNGKRLLTWPELWAVLRWYAHNRGYEPFGDAVEPSDKEDTEKVENAKKAMGQYGTNSMAETICQWLQLDPLEHKLNSHHLERNLRRQNTAFPRKIVKGEVRQILSYHIGKLEGMNQTVIKTLLDDAHVMPVPTLTLQKRFHGGLLFGRRQMRYDNRIIGHCPFAASTSYNELKEAGKSDAEARTEAIKKNKLPGKKCKEFLEYRWGMLMGNIRVARDMHEHMQPLNKDDRATLHNRMKETGRMTKKPLRDEIRNLGYTVDNLDTLLMHPDAEKAFLLDPVVNLIASSAQLSAIWPTLPQNLQNRLRKRWWRKNPETRTYHSVTIADIRAELLKYNGDCLAFDQALSGVKEKPKKTKKGAEQPAEQSFSLDKEMAALSGRAPYTKERMREAFQAILRGEDPKAKGGCLEETDAIKAWRESLPIEQQTNNHLIRHRMLIFRRLLRDIINDPNYGNGKAGNIQSVIIEVNRDLREFSGKSAKEIETDLNIRLRAHKDAVKWLEEAGIAPTGTLIRKARIALDMGKRCPYTGVEYEAKDLVEGRVDLDHVIPRSLRPSDSLDSLVVTFPAINRWKDNRTAQQFIKEFGGQEVPSTHLANTGETRKLSIMTDTRFAEFVKKLDFKGHDDDKKRKKRRKEFLLMDTYKEREGGFTPGQLTQTSQLTRLARVVIHQELKDFADHRIIAIPGGVTAVVRKSWDLMGCLGAVVPEVLDLSGELRKKEEIRSITHLHHAVDAVTLGLASMLLTRDGDIWRLMLERRIPQADRSRFKLSLPVDMGEDGKWRLHALPESLKKKIAGRLAEMRVVRHIPADMTGLILEENTRGIERIEDGRVYLHQKGKRDETGRRIGLNKTNEVTGKVYGIEKGKLAAQNGVRVITTNYGVAVLDNPDIPANERFVIIPFAQVWRKLAELTRLNNGKRPMVLRNGQILNVPEGKRPGLWRVMSVKNNAQKGIILDLATVDSTSVKWSDVLLKSLLKNKASLVNSSLTANMDRS